MKNFKNVGHWWADKSIGLIEINGKVYALSGWNGEKYLECWECTGEDLMDAGEEEYILVPNYDSFGDVISYSIGI